MTRDLGGTATTTEFTDAICRETRARGAGTSVTDRTLDDVATRCSSARRSRAVCGRSRRQPDRGAPHASRRIWTSCTRHSATSLYRLLQHPLYPIFRKITTHRGESGDRHRRAVKAGRVIYVSNHKSHTDYLVELDRPRRPRDPAAAHRGRDQPVRRPARTDPPPRDRGDPDPARHQRPGLPDHAEGVRRPRC